MAGLALIILQRGLDHFRLAMSARRGIRCLLASVYNCLPVCHVSVSITLYLKSKEMPNIII